MHDENVAGYRNGISLALPIRWRSSARRELIGIKSRAEVFPLLGRLIFNCVSEAWFLHRTQPTM
jgi:hypothetical protein